LRLVMASPGPQPQIMIADLTEVSSFDEI